MLPLRYQNEPPQFDFGHRKQSGFAEFFEDFVMGDCLAEHERLRIKTKLGIFVACFWSIKKVYF